MSKIFKKISKLTSSEILELLAYLRLDIYFALFTVGFFITGIPLSQFVQDKHCINGLHKDPSICLNLEKLGTQYESLKNEVYTFSTIFKNYHYLISTPPSVILAIFIGYWMDTYPNHLKYLLALPCLGGCLVEVVQIYNVVYFDMDVYYLLVASIPHCLSGGFFIVMTGSYTYITRRTRAKYRAARFAIFELFMLTSMTLATALGGKILTLSPWLIPQHRNYMAVFIVAFLCKFFSMVWVLMMLNDAAKPIVDPDSVESSDRSQSIKSIDKEPSTPLKDFQEVKLGETDHENNEQVKVADKLSIELEPLKSEAPAKSIENFEKENKDKPTGFLEVVKDIFNPSTVKTMIKVCFRLRPNNGRMILWNLMLAMNIMLIGHIGEGAIGFPFSQKVYHWDAAYYSYISSMAMLIPTAINSLLPIVLIHKFHLADTTLAIMGSTSLIMSLTIKGGILQSYAFFISVIVGIGGGLLPIAIRSIISRIIDQSEAGQVYALLACIESSGPMVASVVYSAIFNVTIKDLPGLVHHFAALTMFYPFIVALWLDWTRKKWDPTAVKVPIESPKNEDEVETIKSNQLNQVNVVR